VALSTSAPELPTRPYLKPWYRLGRGEGKLVLEYGHSSIVLEGRATERLLPSLLAALDGTRTVAEIETMFGEAAAPAVCNALRLLCERRLLSDGPPLDDGEARPVADTVHFSRHLSTAPRSRLCERHWSSASSTSSERGRSPWRSAEHCNSPESKRSAGTGRTSTRPRAIS